MEADITCQGDELRLPASAEKAASRAAARDRRRQEAIDKLEVRIHQLEKEVAILKQV